jgi:hypothetical protein
MATKTQYDVFKAIYDEEIERHGTLENRAKLYLTILTFYLGAIAFKIEDILKFITRFHVPLWLYMAMALVLILALLLTVLATRIRSYEGICDPKKVLLSFGEATPTDEDFLDARIADLAVATNHNDQQNNKVGTYLEIASWLLFLAVLLQLTVFILAVINSRKAN